MARFHSDVVLTRFNFSLLKENIYLFIISCGVKVLLFTEINDLCNYLFQSLRKTICNGNKQWLLLKKGKKCFLSMICPINSYQKMSGDKVEKVDKIKSCFNLI